MASDDISIRRKRLAHRSRYRGFLESDIIFERFAREVLPRLSPEQLDRYEALLDEADHDLFAWVVGLRPVPVRHDNDVFALVREFQNRPSAGANV
jgi:antitoxin CptB